MTSNSNERKDAQNRDTKAHSECPSGPEGETNVTGYCSKVSTPTAKNSFLYLLVELWAAREGSLLDESIYCHINCHISESGLVSLEGADGV